MGGVIFLAFLYFRKISFSLQFLKPDLTLYLIKKYIQNTKTREEKIEKT